MVEIEWLNTSDLAMHTLSLPFSHIHGGRDYVNILQFLHLIPPSAKADISHHQRRCTFRRCFFMVNAKFLQMLAISSQIYALFGRLFTGLNNAVVYQNDNYQVCLQPSSASSTNSCLESCVEEWWVITAITLDVSSGDILAIAVVEMFTCTSCS